MARSNALLLDTLGADVTLVAPPTLLPVGVEHWPVSTSYDLDTAVEKSDAVMGGTGSGIAYSEEDLYRLAGAGLAASPTTEVLIEESILGWKEYELEVMRDKADNVVIICSIENFDAMGVHTGDSITVAPIQTLTDKEYQLMRELTVPATLDFISTMPYAEGSASGVARIR